MFTGQTLGTIAEQDVGFVICLYCEINKGIKSTLSIS